MSSKRTGLGKGLGALLQNADTDITSSGDSQALVGNISQVQIEQIEANPFQPRTDFEKEALIDLTNSIREHGIIQPITLRKMGRGKYQIISGERRFRAAQIVGLTEVPAYIRIANDQTMLEMAIVENIQREDLNAIEVALSFQRLIDECSLTQEELSEKVGKKRSTVTNYLRLLKLPSEVQAALRDKKISMGHARAILGLKSESDQLKALKEILEGNLSVRKTEELAKTNLSEPKSKVPEISFTKDQNRKIGSISARLNQKLTVSKNNKGKGKIVINFKNDEELSRLLDLLDD